MTVDIVAMLREWADNAEEQGVENVVTGLQDAANEIERVREERDEIRLSYCLLMESYRGGDGKVTANKLGWGYLFAEDSK